MRLAAALAALTLLPPSLRAQDPQTAVLSQFSVDEQQILAAVLADPAQAGVFQADAAAAAGNPQAIKEAAVKWRAALVSYAGAYVGRAPATNTAARSIKEMVEPGEWAAIMQFMRTMAAGWKKDLMIGMIKDANDKAAKGDASKAQSVISMARDQIKAKAQEYLATDAAKAAPGEYARLAKASQEREKALEQARRAKELADKAKGLPTPEDVKGGSGPGFDGEKPKPPVAVVPPPGGKAPGDDLPPADPAPAADPMQDKPNLTLQPSTGKSPEKTGSVVPPPAFGATASDEAELAGMDSGTGGGAKVRKWAAVGGGLLFGGIGLLFGPIGAIVGLVLGAAAGYFGSKLFLPD